MVYVPGFIGGDVKLPPSAYAQYCASELLLGIPVSLVFIIHASSRHTYQCRTQGKSVLGPDAVPETCPRPEVGT